MKFIYWDTTTEWIVIEIWEEIDGNHNLLYESKNFSPRAASHSLILDIQTALRACQISQPDFIVVATGPGSFTGIRIAVSAGRNLSQLWNIPCIGLDSLEIYANYYYMKLITEENNFKSKILVLLDGKMNKYFGRVIDSEIDGPTVDCSLEKYTSELGGSFWNEYRVFSHTPLSHLHQLFSLDYPGLKGILATKPGYFNNINIKDNNYLNLQPNYMRGTYVDK
ncbi:tRNA (adenosine(37)-N6)-threonylcarbamoyltransferase complex dimerization subunit type 1 TsaB [Leptospira sp. GIMC2001]|uniref:tRNA (adenosine(37)-N6)-threonylcarbamoyltransferase complex dimerization subunit type 1 TsaB n=1 Tax=Leptospira sp. GIMC2001 TaxID=1513297 RepID=UPI002349AE2F|nr:tRNA (adenosine(37)-N6)-threonylcarbamoyltransferase complex dimerization subunit type 1 TsaB [Leptospira sp. GIMC2001]WCL49549.1 tRNA (adenosine(37)-N6)-threonylcarbamoyltransferase complex dimerization subunit type 1 TsaB [Leptospira sp. GIMC2001]